MAKRMLVDATHPEETRVVVVSGKRLEEFDFETTSKKQLKGNIYLAKVTRVEPSLQAAFVDYGGNRHGFLAFNEIHPDYYRIPVADREALLAEQAALGDAEDVEDEEDDDSADARPEGAESEARSDGEPEAENGAARSMAADAAADRIAGNPEDLTDDEPGEAPEETPEAIPGDIAGEATGGLAGTWPTEPDGFSAAAEETAGEAGEAAEAADDTDEAGSDDPAPRRSTAPSRSLETVGGDEIEDAVEPRRPRNSRRYKIQEVIKRRQIMLVQVTKEERGNKGAALTTYLSLAGRYCVLMPNTDRGGGVSRKITNAADRKRLKSIIEELDIPEGMAVIVRTAGSERSKAEIRRDYEYLLRLWDEIRELTLKSTAPALIYEEANLIKRSIRDLYSRDTEDILVEGEDGYKAAKAFMRTLTPSHAKRVQLYKDPTTPLFHRYQVEGQLDAIHNPVVQLKSGGYIVINPTEALVAIDVNSGRSTRERNIEETALRTNLEAAEEVARQLRLRDLAGLIVIDFIDMEEARHNSAVERRLKEAMRNDRARIQLGHISPFGLLELSRQRLRPSLVEASTEICPRCRGVGHIRSTESTALHVLRSIEEEGIRNRSAAITVQVPTAVALYVLNQKRRALAEVEMRHNLRVFLSGDDTLIPPDFRIERMRALTPESEAMHPVSHVSAPLIEDEPDEADEEAVEATSEAAEHGEQPSVRRRSRRRRRRRDDDGAAVEAGESPRQDEAAELRVGDAEQAAIEQTDGNLGTADADEAGEGATEEGGRRRRRGRRGGRRRSRRGETATAAESTPDESTSDEPTPETEPAGLEMQPSEPESAGFETQGETQGEVQEAEPEALPADIEQPIAETPVEPSQDDMAAPHSYAEDEPEPELQTPELQTPEADTPRAREPEHEAESEFEQERPGTTTPSWLDETIEPLAAAGPEEQEQEQEQQPADDETSDEQERGSPEPVAALSYIPLPSAHDRIEASGEPGAHREQPSDENTPSTGSRRRGWWRR
ncbi:ribonuclease E/G [Rhodospirillaceae bacterium SYSU D60014]|uniref:ribonuclease E/G n=1 Tax=Virgifigura deserti TaxID=2268457 RepID=UPI000E66B445